MRWVGNTALAGPIDSPTNTSSLRPRTSNFHSRSQRTTSDLQSTFHLHHHFQVKTLTLVTAVHLTRGTIQSSELYFHSEHEMPAIEVGISSSGAEHTQNRTSAINLDNIYTKSLKRNAKPAVPRSRVSDKYGRSLHSLANRYSIRPFAFGSRKAATPAGHTAESSHRPCLRKLYGCTTVPMCTRIPTRRGRPTRGHLSETRQLPAAGHRDTVNDVGAE